MFRMRFGAWLLLVLSACATGPKAPLEAAPSKPAEPVPSLVAVSAAVGISEEPLRAVIQSRLLELSQCVAITELVEGRLTPIQGGEGGDDRVEVKLYVSARKAPQPQESPWRVEAQVQGALSQPSCVAHLVSSWPFEEVSLQAMAKVRRWTAPGMSFVYRYRPSQAARTQRVKANGRAFAEFCSVFSEAKRGQPLLPLYRQGRQKVRGDLQLVMEPVLEMEGAISGNDFAAMVAAAARDLGASLGVKLECRAFRGWLPITDAELMESETLPVDESCVDRVEQMRQLGQEILPSNEGYESALSSPRARPVAEPGLLVDARQPRAELPLLASAKKVRSLAIAESKLQGRSRPLVYLKVDPALRAKELVEAAKRWGVDFEVRLLATRSGLAPLEHAKEAWPEAVMLYQEQLSNVRSADRATRLIDAFSQAGPHCAPVPELIAQLYSLAPVDRLPTLATGLARALEECGCPHAWSEVAWARLALIADEWDGGVGWVPLSVATKEPAPAVELPSAATVEQLVEVLGDAPLRVKWR